MNDNEVQVKITADATKVAPGIDVAKAAVKGLSESTAAATMEMRGHFASVSTSVREMGVTIRETVGMVGEMREAMMAFGEAMIAAFAIEKVADWAKEMGEGAEKVRHTAEIFGMTVPQVQGLQAAAAATGMSFEGLTKGMAIFDKNLVSAASGSGTAAQAFKVLGISVNDGKSQMEKLLAVADKFQAMENGPKKVALAMETFGRAGKEMIPLLNLGAAGIEKLDQRSQEYSAGVLVATAANKDLREWLDQVNARGVALAESTNESKIAMQGLGNVMTDAFAPVLKEAADGMNTLIQGFVESYREGGIVAAVINTINGILEEMGAVIGAVAEIFQAWWGIVSEVVGEIGGIIADIFGVKVVHDMATGTLALNLFKDALTVLKDSVIIAVEIIGSMLSRLVGYLQAFAKVADDAFHMNWGAIDGDWAAGMNSIASHAEESAKRIKSAMDEAGAAIKAAMSGQALPGKKSEGEKEGKESKGFDPDLTKPAKVKKPKKEKADPGDKDNSATTDLEEAKDAAAAKLAIAESNATTIEELAKLSAQEQMDAVQKAESLGVITKRQATAQKVALIATEVQAEIVAANTIYQAKVTKLNADQAAEVASFAAKQAALDKSSKDYLTKFTNLQNQIQAAQTKTDNQLQVLATQHENQLTTINAKGIAARDKAEAKSVSQREAMEKTAITSISQSWSSALGQMATGQMSFADGIKSMWSGIVSMIGGALSNMIEKWMQQQLTAMIFGKATQAASGLAQVTSNAAIAGSAAWASTAAIPIVGPELAPAAAGAAFAGAMSFAPMASAFGGWGEVPYDGAQAILHAREMVLPASIATPLRSMIASGGVNDNQAAARTHGGDTFHIHATDAQSFQRMLSTEEGQNGIVAGLRKARAGLKA